MVKNGKECSENGSVRVSFPNHIIESYQKLNRPVSFHHFARTCVINEISRLHDKECER